MRYRVKMTLLFLCLVAAAFSATAYSLISEAWKANLAQVQEAALQNHSLVADTVERNLVLAVMQEEAEWEVSLERMKLTNGLGERGNLLGVSLEGEGVSLMEGRPIAPAESAELRANLDSDTGADSLFWYLQEEGKSRVILVGQKLYMNGNALYLCSATDAEPAFTAMERQRQFFRRWFILAILVSFGTIYLMTTLLTRRLRVLHRAAEEIQQGHYETRVSLSSGDEIAELGQVLNQMARAVEEKTHLLEEENQRKDAFIGGFTHEFRTPLAGMMGYAALLQKETDPDTRLIAGCYILSEGKRLEDLTQKLFELFLAERQEIRRSGVYIPGLLEEAAMSVMPAFEAAGVTLTWQGEEVFWQTDFELLRTVLVNLLDNARKASQPGQTVTMKGTTGFLQVEDEGCGIAPEDKARITEAFYMVDKARSREAGGCGLGLALSSAILRALDLKLEIESEPGKGSCFRIMSLPAAEPYSGKGPKEEAE